MLCYYCLSALYIWFIRTRGMLMTKMSSWQVEFQFISSTFVFEPFLVLHWINLLQMVCGLNNGPHAIKLSAFWFLVPQKSQKIIVFLFITYAITGEISVSDIQTYQKDNVIFFQGYSIKIGWCRHSLDGIEAWWMLAITECGVLCLLLFL